MPRSIRPPPPPLDAPTLAHIEFLLAERLEAVQTYGAPGGCPSCHDGELRGAIRLLRELRVGQRVGQ